MSAVLALLGDDVRDTPDPAVEGLLARMSYRGAEATSVWRSDEALLAVSRDGWEMRPGFAGPALVGSREGIRVVCDATMYYVADLTAHLNRAGVVPASDSAADLIAAAYEAFGAQCVDYLEGDYAFCVWDEVARSLFCARDPFGSRSLFHTTFNGTLVVASTPHPLVSWQGTAASFDPTGILRSVLMRYGDGTTTAWAGINEIPAGHSLRATADGVQLERFWVAKGADRWRGLSSDEAVEALRGLLNDAARERSCPGSTSLAMSGGLDSTSLLASLEPERGNAPDILSFKYPEGDPGDEAWYVNLTADRFGIPVHWVDIAYINFYEDLELRARLRSHCHGHVFEGHNRALATASLALGDRVLLNGHGGDNVMAVGNWTMADLLRRGRLLQLHRYRAARNYHGVRQFIDYCLRPALPFAVFDWLEPLLGRRLCSRPFERPMPAWIGAREELLGPLVKRDRQDYGSRILRSHSSISSQRRAWGLMDCGFHRSCAASFDLTRDEGVELRMPFYDRRLVEFVMSRPAAEFNQPNQYKVLLRRAMEGRLPDRTRAPQPGGFKPGTALGVVKSRWAPETLAQLQVLNDQSWLSEEMGVVDRERFVSAVETGGALHWWSAVDVSLTLFVEIWLRSQRSTRSAGRALPLRAPDTTVVAIQQK